MKKPSFSLRALPMEAVQRGIFYSLGLLVVGVALAGWASESIRAVLIASAALVLAGGVWDVLRYFRESDTEARKNQRFARGLMAAALCVLMLIYGDRLGEWMPILLSALLLFSAAIRCQSALDLQRAGAPHWLAFLIFSGVTAIAAVLMLALNLDADWKLRVIGVFAALDAVADGLARFTLWRLDKKAKRQEVSAKENAATEPVEATEATEQATEPKAAQDTAPQAGETPNEAKENDARN